MCEGVKVACANKKRGIKPPFDASPIHFNTNIILPGTYSGSNIVMHCCISLILVLLKILVNIQVRAGFEFYYFLGFNLDRLLGSGVDTCASSSFAY